MTQVSLDIKFIGEKLFRCRERLQISLNEAANGTGLPVEKLTAIEKGEVEPLGDEILILSDYYKEDYKYFISNQTQSGSEKVDILYRKFANEFSKTDRWAIQEFLFLCECEQYVWELLNFEGKHFHFQKQGTYYKQHGIRAAAALREYLGYTGNGILKNIFDELRRTGAHIFRRKLDNSSISGLFVMHPYAGKCILVNYSEDIYRQNFTLAHEMAHSIFDYEEEFNVSFKDERWDLKEVRANVFASNFLLPEMAIRDLGITNWSIETLHKVANQLKVNITPLLLRLKELELINEVQFETFRKDYIKSDVKEDFELLGLSEKIKTNKKILIEKGLSTFYIRQCHDAYQKRLITRERLSEMLFSDEFELPNILDMFSLKLVYED